MSGLLGGFGHCIGMCGPVVIAYTSNLRERKYIPHFLYNLGRITTYSIIGGIMGLTGSFVGVTQFIEGFQNIVMVFIGALMVIMGL
jgi:sulfite exporter TauE/SafE